MKAEKVATSKRAKRPAFIKVKIVTHFPDKIRKWKGHNNHNKIDDGAYRMYKIQ